jgi:tetratricopeptide (TPR) repeat protein
MAHSYQGAGDLARAEESYRLAVTAAPGDWRNHDWLGIFLLQEKGDFAGAQSAFEAAGRLAPDQRLPREHLAVVAMHQADWRRALELFPATEEDTTSAGLASNIGTAHFFAGNLAQAEHYYRLGLELEPSNPTLLGNLGDLYHRLGRLEEARERYQEALASVEEQLASLPENVELLLAKNLYMAKVGDCDPVAAFPQTLGERIAGSATDYHLLALAHGVCRQETLTLDALSRAIELGFPVELISSEDELRFLDGNQRFEALTATEPEAAGPAAC